MSTWVEAEAPRGVQASAKPGPVLGTLAALILPPLAGVAVGVFNLGQGLSWIAFLSSLVAAVGYLAATVGRAGAEVPARIAFRLQWVAFAACALVLWRLLFTHQYAYEYVASYTSRAMPQHYVFAAFWGGQEGTFVLWGLFTASLGLVMMRVRHSLTVPAMFFLNLPMVMLALVTVMRGPFLMFPDGRVPLDGNGLNPLLQDPWMTIHPPVLFIGFSSLVAPFAVGMAALVRRDYDGWIKPGMPWVVFSTAILATGFIMGGVWAYKVLGWGGYWGWDPVENGSLVPWLSNMALLHGLLIQRASGSLRRTNFVLVVTSYVLVLYASFLTRSGVLGDFSVHSFVNLGLNGFLLSFLFLTMIVGYGLVIFRWSDIPATREPLGHLSRESMMWLGQLVFILMCALITVGMSAPLITKLKLSLAWPFLSLGPAANVQIAYYNLVNAPLAIALGLLMGLAPLMRWRKQDPGALASAALPSLAVALVLATVAIALGVRDPMAAAVVTAACWGLTANVAVTIRGFRSGWKHGIAYMAHTGVAIMLVGIVASSGYGRETQVQLPHGEAREALGYRLTFEGVRPDAEGKDRMVLAVHSSEGDFEATPAIFWNDFSGGYMKRPHIQRFLTHDVYIAPLDRSGGTAAGAVWFEKGESKQIGSMRYTFEGFQVSGMGTPEARVAAHMVVESGGRTAPVRPVVEIGGGQPRMVPAYLPGGGSVTIAEVDANTGRVALAVPSERGSIEEAGTLAVAVSTKPLINLVWLGAIVMLASAFMGVVRRSLDLRRAGTAA